ncbi:uncharacterized protein LOC107811852 [Nicotiana tabacum]|uniref:Uncharacterized protein LOC107811852 n=1 Tax=Nicotiana tabacum TaxID=4097 RepID=A0AC58T2Y1_TOBAC
MPKWPEITRFVESRGLSREDHPDILTEIFKIKPDRMIKDLRDNKIFGEVKAVVYTVEFQKRSLPHAHILLLLRNKYRNVADIDGIISTELPDKKVDPHSYNVVINFMMHGPCGGARKSSPCMQNGRCTKHFPKKIVSSTTIDEDGYPIYGRRDDGRTTKRVDYDKEYMDAIMEESNWGMASYLRQLFVRLLLSNSMSRPESVWQATWHLLSEDILHEERTILDHPEVDPTDDELKNRYLQKLEFFLKGYGRSFQDFPTMPRPVYNTKEVDNINRLIQDELRYNKRALANEHQQLVKNLTDEQMSVYEKIIREVNEDKGGFFFLYGFGGTCKTFLWRTLSSAIKSRGDIVLTVASSGIASLLLPGGRTAHSRFFIPLNLTKDSTCNIKQGTPLANLIVKAKLIIWDEAPMMHRCYFASLDKTLRDILRFKDASNLDRPVGGKTIILGGDFRQILLVIPKGSRQDIVNASLNSSYLWPHCQLLKLTKNMRLQALTILIQHWNMYTPEFLNTIKCSGVPNHALTLKVGIPVMLLRNIDQPTGLCNGISLIITKLENQVIEAKVLLGKMGGQKVFIPRMTLTPSDARIPFKFQLRQLPIIVSFSMTINKSQGQSLSHVGLFLKKYVFTH